MKFVRDSCSIWDIQTTDWSKFIADFSDDFNPYWVLLELVHGVFIGKMIAGKLSVNIASHDLERIHQDLITCRVFNSDSEKFLYRYKGEWLCRTRVDSSVVGGATADDTAIEGEYIMFGERVEHNQSDFCTVMESRGIYFDFPATQLELPLRVVTRSYIRYRDNGLAYIADWRYCGFLDKRGRL